MRLHLRSQRITSRHLLSIAWVAPLMSIVSCGAAHRLTGTLQNLQIVQRELTRLTGHNDIRVVLNNGTLLSISIINSPLRSLPVDQKRAKALELARLAYGSYASSDDLRAVSVVFGIHRDYLGIFRYDDLTDIYTFDVSDLRIKQQNLRPIASELLFVPIGDIPTSEIDALVEHYHEKLGIKGGVLPRVSLQSVDTDPVRHQLIAEHVIDSMLRAFPQYASTSAILIGVTRQDIFPLGEHWQFCFGWRIPQKRAAVVSTARLGLYYRGEPSGEATVSKRLQKIVTKDIGIMYYDMRPNGNPKSVLYNNILGIQELDQVNEDF